MYIKEKLSQSRRDFRAIFACEFCDYEAEDEGYDDDYFHNTVVPKLFKCPKCDKSSGEVPYKPPLQTVYPRWFASLIVKYKITYPPKERGSN